MCLVPATDKVALLIGNLSYQNHPQLKAPMVDVYDLTNLLRQLNFKVVSLLDLTESEMRNAVDEFLLLLHKGVYGTFAFDLPLSGLDHCFSPEGDRNIRIPKHSMKEKHYHFNPSNLSINNI